jgi:triacylglycerol lipase
LADGSRLFRLAPSVNPWLILPTGVTADAGGIVMSFLVSLPEESYRNDAFAHFTANSNFTLGNAQAMMWLSQLAYETDEGEAEKGEKIKRILPRLGLQFLEFGTNELIPGLLRRKACFIVATRPDATFVAFAGTDPLKPQDVITDLEARVTTEGLHQGFAQAAGAVQSAVEGAITRGGAGKPLFFTGHSLGGALAMISAMRTRAAQITAVYTFGGARAGDRRFFDSYGANLRSCTFRLVNGTDIVASVPPSLSNGFFSGLIGGLLVGLRGGFRHVGRLVHCPQRSLFAEPAPTQNDGNEPDDFLKAGIDAAFGIFRQIPDFTLQKPDPLTLDTNSDLPEQIRDHVPASYFRALNMPLAPPP